MPHYTLSYFDFDGGRGEPIRIALHASGIAFEDKRLSFEQFTGMRAETPFNALPVFQIDDVTVTQSNAICRYVGRMTGLYPEDPLQALFCDEVMDAQEDLSQCLGPTFSMSGEEQRLAREKLVGGRMSVFIRGLGRLLVRGGGEYFADNRLTIADLKTFVSTRWLRSGSLDHVPTDLVDTLAPGLVDHQQRVAQDPRVLAYYASRRK